MLPQAAKRGRTPTNRWWILDAILYVVNCGVSWRYLQANFPPWKTVFLVFRQWPLHGRWTALNDSLRVLVRQTHAKRSRPTAAIPDSQSVKPAGDAGEVGYDAEKRIKGRKRNFLADTLGLVLGVANTPANTPECEGGRMALGRVIPGMTWLRCLWANGRCTGDAFANWVKELRPLFTDEVVKRSDDTCGFKVLPRRWVVERTFGWLMRYRRPVRDYGITETSAEAWVLCRLDPNSIPPFVLIP